MTTRGSEETKSSCTDPVPDIEMIGSSKVSVIWPTDELSFKASGLGDRLILPDAAAKSGNPARRRQVATINDAARATGLCMVRLRVFD